MRSFLAVACLVLSAARVDASPITINNALDTTDKFLTIVSGSIGLVPDIHFLVDIPGTPWESSSTINEASNGGLPLLGDVLSVSWTIQHLIGPHNGDVDPNPNEPVTLSLTFRATAPGPFGTGSFICSGGLGVFTAASIPHPTTVGAPHFDELCLNVFGTVTTGLLGSLDISSYTIDYFALHCVTLDPTAFGCEPAPEPPTIVLLASGGLLIPVAIAWRRRQRILGRLKPATARWRRS